MKTSITKYYPNQRFSQGWIAIWKEMIQNIIGSKDMILQLYKRDFTAQYKKSFLGLAWVLINPLIGIISWVAMQLTGVLEPGDVGIPYPIYVLVGSTVWGLFMGLVNAASSTLTSAGRLVQQVKFPHESILVKQVMLSLTNFAISIFLVLVGISFFGVIPHWKTIFVIPLILPFFFLASSVGLLISMINIVAIDISNIINKLLNFLIYTVPIIYAPNVDSEMLRLINLYNPLTYLIVSMRDLILFGTTYDLSLIIYCSIGSFILFLIIWRTFYISEHKLIERMI